MKEVAIGSLLQPVELVKEHIEPFLYIDLSAVEAGRKEIRRVSWMNPSEAPSRARQVVKAGDVLVAMVRPNLNSVASVPPEYDGAIASTGFSVLRPRPGVLSPRFLFHWVRTPAFINDMVLSSTGVSYPAVSSSVVRNSRLPLLPWAEQRRIAAILDQADELRAKRRRTLALLDEHLDASFEVMACDASPSQRQPLHDIATMQGGLTVSHRRRDLETLAPYLRVANVDRGEVSVEDLKVMGVTANESRRTSLRADDIVVVEGHGNRDEVGRAALVRHEIDGLVHQNHLIRVRASEEVIDPRFLESALNSKSARAHFRQVAKTTSGLNTINMSNLRSVPILVPSMSEQQRYVLRVRAVEKLKAAANSHLAHLDELFASLQHRAFTGRL